MQFDFSTFESEKINLSKIFPKAVVMQNFLSSV